MPPTYDYVCTACEHAFEEFQSMSEAPLKKCPKCGKRRLRRLFGTGSGIIFKGSGFYETDYKRKSGGGGPKKESDSGGDSKPDSKPESKSESKSESKPDPKPAKKDSKK